MPLQPGAISFCLLDLRSGDPTAIVDFPEMLALLRQGWTIEDREALLCTFQVILCQRCSNEGSLPPSNAWAVRMKEWQRDFNERRLKDPRIRGEVEVMEIKVSACKGEKWVFARRGLCFCGTTATVR